MGGLLAFTIDGTNESFLIWALDAHIEWARVFRINEERPEVYNINAADDVNIAIENSKPVA